MFALLFIAFFFVAPSFAQDTSTDDVLCDEFEADQNAYASCLVHEAVALAREADAKRIEAEERAVLAEAHAEAARRYAETSSTRAVATISPAPAPVLAVVPPAPAAPTPRVVETTITPRGVQNAAILGRQVSPTLAPTQVCVYNLDGGVRTHMGQSVRVSSVRIVAISADGIPVIPNAGVSVMTYPTFADIEGNGNYQMFTAFSPNAEEICLPSQHGQAITLVYLRDTGMNRRTTIDTDGDTAADQLEETPMYGGPNTGSVAVTYPNTSYGIRKVPASGGSRGHRQ